MTVQILSGILAAGMLMPVVASTAAADNVTTRETILFVRHAEKPGGGLGQLSCKGLNRALALAGVIKARYGHLDAVFAPDPARKKPDDADGEAFDYVRPLATVEPTAVAFGLPVQASLGYDEIDKLGDALLAPAYRNATILVGWEHHAVSELVPKLFVALGGDARKVPEWAKTDFDSIWRVTIDRAADRTTIVLALEKEGLDGQPETCPH